MPEAILIAGPNGAGKTTFARRSLQRAYPDAYFLNADDIQREADEFDDPISSGREFLRRLSEMEARLDTFAVESTLSSRMYIARIRLWKALGYHVTLHFIELPSADEAVRRVASRVAAGGHSIPEVDIRRRFDRGLKLFHETYRSLVDEWYHYQSDDGGLRLVERHRKS